MAQSTIRPEEGFEVEISSGLQTLLKRYGGALRDAVGELCKSKTAFIGGVMLLILAAMLILTPYIDRYSPVKQNYRELLKPPSAAHYFGTDRYGRDIWSRVLWGGRRLMVISLCAVGVGLLLGIPFGALSGYYGGRIDAVSMRFVDAWLALPGLLIYLVLVTIVREWGWEGVWLDMALTFALGIGQVPRQARLVRGSVLAEKEKEYVEASHVIGEANLYIALRQILPNCMSPVIVQATVYLGFTLLVIAALSFLGLGAPPPTPDWGYDLNLARDHMETRPLIAVFPGLAISYAVLAFNLFGDGLRDILDPRLVDR
ncbi:Glutathione transport system permease protein GsiD [Candidatus Entotheonellaceae bacterium PAL068K]